MRRELDADHVKFRLEGLWEIVYQDLLHGESLEGFEDWRAARCPFHDDENPSLSINVEHGGWKCHAGCGSGDVFDFVMKLEKCDFPAAVRRVAEVGGLLT